MEKPTEATTGEAERDTAAEKPGAGEGTESTKAGGEGEERRPWQEEREELLREAEERAYRRLQAERAAEQPTDKAQPKPTDDPEAAAILAEHHAIEAQVVKDGGYTAETLQRSQRLQNKVLALGLARTDRELRDMRTEREAEAKGEEKEWKDFFREHKGEGTPEMLRLAFERKRDVKALERAEAEKKDAERRKQATDRRVVDVSTRDVTAREVTVRKMTQEDFDKRQKALREAGRDAEAIQEQRDYRRGKIEVTR